MVEFCIAVETFRKKSIGPIIRCAVAFNCKTVYVIGSDKFTTHGAHRSQKHVRMQQFSSWDECITHVRSRGDYEICALSPTQQLDNDLPIASCNKESIELKEFKKSTLFILCDKINSNEVVLCDSIVFVPFFNAKSEHLVKYVAKLSICFYKFTTLFPETYQEKDFNDEKYDVDDSCLNDFKDLVGSQHLRRIKSTTPGLSLSEDISLCSLFEE